MDLAIKGKGIDVGGALREHATEHLNVIVGKYFSQAVSAAVTLSREAHLFRADISVHPVRGVTLQGHSAAEDAYAAFDSALDRIAKQLRRYKRRLNDHHKARTSEEAQPAYQYIIAPEAVEEELPAEGQPAIIAEMPTEIISLTVSEAVMRMDLADLGAVVFRNSTSGALNVVFRRSDGNIGWIDTADRKL